MNDSVYTFGKKLLKTNDLDPVYVLLWEAKLDRITLNKWLLAYWCFYHVGTASWIVDQPGYWEAMRTAAGSKDYLRCSERRHFRGENARKSVEYLCRRKLVPLFKFGKESTVAEIMKKVQTWVGFGPWIAFKVADMLERLDLCNVEFDTGAMFLFDSPKQGAELMREMYGKGKDISDVMVGARAVESILARLGNELAPPRYERKINVQEAETILCKWKSYMNGRYHVGEDIEACQKALMIDNPSETVEALKHGAMEVGLWQNDVVGS